MIDTITVGTRQRILRKMNNVAINDDDSAYQEVVDLFGKLYK